MRRFVKGQPCPKCGENHRRVRWCDMTASTIALARLFCPTTRIEHMHACCTYCGFEELSLPLDAEAKP